MNLCYEQRRVEKMSKKDTQENTQEKTQTATAPVHLPKRLQKFVVEQRYSRYTSVDQAVWRYILRQLKNHLSFYGHKSYIEGLTKTGLDTEQIPRIEEVSCALEKFGWRALPVSGFIPPAIFMEMQSLGYLPIASDMRSIDHIHYTPAPDIVHEAAGHAPIISDSEYSQYLKNYAQVSRKAIISSEDLAQYEAIRILSDLKEHPDATKKQIQEAEENLIHITKNMSHVSEAASLGRMNWWTAEYGLIGGLENPKIFGAGLLSSIGESRSCFEKNVKKIPLSIECVKQSYDITEPQPQLFVTPDFETLNQVLEDFKNQMAFVQGGVLALKKALQACSVNTVEMNTGLQISGKVAEYLTHPNPNSNPKSSSEEKQETVIYFRMEGPCQLSYKNQQLHGHGKDYHSHGYSTPVGLIKGFKKCLSLTSPQERQTLGLIDGEQVQLVFESGICVKGQLKHSHEEEGRLLLLSFDNCTVSHKDKTLFDPEWGVFDMAVGTSVSSVYGGAADEDSYGATTEFVNKEIPLKDYNEKEIQRHKIYQAIRDVRSLSPDKDKQKESTLHSCLLELNELFPTDWLAYLEIYEWTKKQEKSPIWSKTVLQTLEKLCEANQETRNLIEDGLKLIAH